jgi:outer membrane protein TolC
MKIFLRERRAWLLTGIFLSCLAMSVNTLAAEKYVVFGSFSNKENALVLSDELLQQVPAELAIISVDRGAQKLYRIVSGPHDQRTAISIKSAARQTGISGAWIWSGNAHPMEQQQIDVSESKPQLTTDVEPAENLATSAEVSDIDSLHQAQADSPVSKLVEQEYPQIEGEPSESSSIINAKLDRISLRQAVQIALKQNPVLLASVQQVAAGEAGVRQARSALLPSLTSSIQQTAIDQDRAETSFGRAPEYRATASLQLKQVIYSEEVKANYDIQKMLQASLESDQKGVMLDTILRASTSYLALLRAKTLLRIFEDDLQLTDSNYDRSKIRLELGVANKAEVYRWETAQASSRKDLVLAEAAVAQARINLNMVLNLPLGKEFETINPTLEDSSVMIADPIVWERLKNENRKRELKNFLSTEALLFAPELSALREKQSAQRRAVLAARRSFTLPTVALVLDGSKFVSNRGKGTDQLSISIPGSEARFGGQTDNTEWSAAVAASLPLYKGGERLARVSKANAELARIDLLYDAALQKTQAEVLTRLEDVQASIKNIELSRDAARASRNNLQLVIDSYERGVVTNIDLLDAQFALLSSELSVANTVFDFMLNYLSLQRAVGNFDIVSTPEQTVKIRQRMDQFYL